MRLRRQCVTARLMEADSTLPMNNLTAAEKRVLTLVSEAKTNRGWLLALCISPATVSMGPCEYSSQNSHRSGRYTPQRKWMCSWIKLRLPSKAVAENRPPDADPNGPLDPSTILTAQCSRPASEQGFPTHEHRKQAEGREDTESSRSPVFVLRFIVIRLSFDSAGPLKSKRPKPAPTTYVGNELPRKPRTRL